MLLRVLFHSISQLQEYVAEFRKLENEIFDMNYTDRLQHFLDRVSHNCRMYVLTTPGIRQAGDIELAYRVAPDWAASTIYFSHLEKWQPASIPHGKHRRQSIVRGNSVAMIAPATSDKPEEERDVIDERTAECYKCGKIGHFACSCRHSRKSRSSTAGRRKPTTRTRFDRLTLYQLEVKGGDSESESNEEEERDSYYYDSDYVDENHTADGTEYLNLIATYELDTDIVLVVDSDSDNMEHMPTSDLVASLALLCYNANINGADAKLVIDSAAITQFVDETTVHAIASAACDSSNLLG